MTQHYRTFQIDSGVQPILDRLLGRINRRYATGNILYKRSDHSLVELDRFRLACMKFDDKDVAERFGLELAAFRRCILSRFRHRAIRDRTAAHTAKAKPALTEQWPAIWLEAAQSVRIARHHDWCAGKHLAAASC